MYANGCIIHFTVCARMFYLENSKGVIKAMISIFYATVHINLIKIKNKNGYYELDRSPHPQYDESSWNEIELLLNLSEEDTHAAINAS